MIKNSVAHFWNFHRYTVVGIEALNSIGRTEVPKILDLAFKTVSGSTGMFLFFFIIFIVIIIVYIYFSSIIMKLLYLVGSLLCFYSFSFLLFTFLSFIIFIN